MVISLNNILVASFSFLHLFQPDIFVDDLSPEMRTYTVKDLSTSTYKFTVKAYTSAGEDTGGTAAITLKQCGV